MAVAKIDIANFAVSHLAVGLEIQDFDNEKTEAAQACRRFYDIARQKVLRDFDWPFASATEFMAQLANPVGLTRPTTEWTYWYRYPAKALAVRRILNQAMRTDTSLSRAEYSIGRDATGRVIYADLLAAQIQYTYDEDDTTRFPPDFVVALSFYLAFLIGPRVSGGDQFKLADRAYLLYKQAIAEAWVNAAREEPRDPDPDPDLVNIR